MSRNLPCLISSGFVLLLLANAVSAAAGSLDDPTRPPGKRVYNSVVKQKSNGWRLASTLISPERRSAIINGRRVTVGDRVNGARVLEIQPAWVKLQTGKGDIQIGLRVSGKITKTVRMSGKITKTVSMKNENE